MSRMTAPATACCLSLVLAFPGSHVALAVDAEHIADMIVTRFGEVDGMEARYESATSAGDDVIITGLHINQGEQTLDFDSILIVAPELVPEGGFTTELVEFGEGRAARRESVISWQTGMIDGAALLSDGPVGDGMIPAKTERFGLTGLIIEMDSYDDPIPIAEIEMRFGEAGEQSFGRLAIDARRMELPASIVAEQSRHGAPFDALGYSDILTDIFMDFSYDEVGEALNIDRFSLSADEVGGLHISGRVGGISPETLQSLDDGALPAGLASPLLEKFELRFDNAGYIERYLDHQASQSGVSPEAIGQQIVAELGMLLEFIGDPALKDEAIAVAGAFFNDPRSLRISVSPDRPLAFMEIMGLAMTGPQLLPALLGLEVAANE